ncbi:MAG: hypothetical protein JSV78_01040 [Phycisphaerales bacterium]|nr:MAG: hypothetical protein JSV78_01040 [Phycisphaerales bacterium]
MRTIFHSSAARLALFVMLWPEAAMAQKHKLVYAKDGSGVFGYKDTLPWCTNQFFSCTARLH